MNKHNIGLVSINARYTHVNLALYYIKQVLNKTPEINTTLLEYTIQDPLLTVLTAIEQAGFSAIIFSVYIWNSEFIRKLIPEIKKVLANTRIILGGPEVGCNINTWLSIPGIDCIVKGNAEPVIASIIENIQNQKALPEIIHSPAADFDTVPFPYSNDDIKNLTGRTVYYEASRGCAYSCSYCISALEDQKLSYKSADTVKQELEFFFNLDVKIIKFIDRTFNTKKEFAREIWQYISNREPRIPFHFEIHPVLLEEKDLNFFKSVPGGLFHFEIGIQTVHSKTLSIIRRKGTWDEIKNNVKHLCSIKNIHTHCDVLVGLPGENRIDIIKSINEVLSCNPDHLQLGFLKILPGTPIAAEKESFGIQHMDSPPYEVLSTRQLSFSEIQYFHQIEKLLNILYNSDFFSHTIRYLLSLYSTPFSFFEEFNSFCRDKIDFTTRQWAQWAKLVLQNTELYFPAEIPYIIDLLRYDWCPFSNAQNYPACIADKKKNETLEIRRHVYEKLLQDEIPVSKHDFNRSILYIPESVKMKIKLGNQIILFLNAENRNTISISWIDLK